MREESNLEEEEGGGGGGGKRNTEVEKGREKVYWNMDDGVTLINNVAVLECGSDVVVMW